MIDIEKARQDTPGCDHVTHFNNAGAALMPRIVRDTVVDHIDRELLIGGYEAATETAKRHSAVYTSIAKLIHAHSSEIALMTSATHAWVQAFYAIPFKHGDKIVTVQAEYASNYIAFLHIAKLHGVEIVVVPNDATGQVSIDALEDALDDKVKLIAMTHVPTNSGLVNPAAAVGELARQNKILYLLDACQSVGQIPIDVTNIGCDILSATGRKYLRAPRGTGFLYVRHELIAHMTPPTLDLHSATWVNKETFKIHPDARRFEKWETSIANRLGLGAAVNYALDFGIDNIWVRVKALAETLRVRLSAIPEVTIRDLGIERCGIVTFTLDGYDHHDLKVALHQQKINVTVSSRSSTQLDMGTRGLESVMRASLHYYNTNTEIDQFCESIAKHI